MDKLKQKLGWLSDMAKNPEKVMLDAYTDFKPEDNIKFLYEEDIRKQKIRMVLRFVKDKTISEAEGIAFIEEIMYD